MEDYDLVHWSQEPPLYEAVEGITAHNPALVPTTQTLGISSLQPGQKMESPCTV